jgi:hypothetical protein
MEVDLDSSYVRLCVYGEITTERKIHKVRLTRTSDYFSNTGAEGVVGAEVSISEGSNNVMLFESDSLPGLYQTGMPVAGVVGRTYNLNISNVDVDNDGRMESYSASSYLPPVSQVDSIRLTYYTSSFFSGWQVQLYSLDPVDRKDFYAFKIYKNDTLLTDSISEYACQSDELFNGNYTNGITVHILMDDKPDEKVDIGDKITFELNGITEEYYNFILEAQTEIAPKIPLFSGPGANVHSNISNNAVGFFTAYSVSKSSVLHIKTK